ncbi:protein of unknown function [Acidithiobacillus ferrivorans]|uniref:Uncharacterized protein n=1 Tax=Acidithiobacillus ferrivorans TaxID=160808 RepID=A0A060URS9_9PROT|nr:hypothetical protein AFERRI_470005 [Acidithiobacillus ferrivorans]SMH65782.1 protein of unknown function [Acidithiobacillus ferrivorans]
MRDNGGKVSNKLLKEFPILADKALTNEVDSIIQAAPVQP